MAKKLVIHQDTTTVSQNPLPIIDNSANNLSFNDDVLQSNFEIGLEDHDRAILKHIENVIKPQLYQNNQLITVPISVGNNEIWQTIQQEGYYRDVNGKLLVPFIVLNRTNVETNREYINKIDPSFPQTNFVIETKYNKRNSYDKFSILNNIIPQKELHVIQVPDYVTLTYEVFMITNFFQHMNHLVESFVYANNSYWGDGKYKFKVNYENISNSTEFSIGEERFIKNQFSIKLNGYILPKVLQKDINQLGKYNSKSKLTIKTETVTSL
jgi:hypothetical protein